MQTFTPYKALTRIHAIFAFAFIAVLSFCACSNSEGVDYANYAEIADDNDVSSDGDNPQTQDASSSSKVIDYLPLDDTEYPYAGIPRIVIETEKHQAIKDRETEIPAKLQIWGEKTPESEVMDLTIRGRGNTSWDYMPKKSYKIEFVNKQEMLGMPKDRDWALIANYVDKTMMKNYLMYHLSAELGAYYAPRCAFTELYINREYLGVYLLTETVKIAKHRVNIPKNEDSYLIEVDARVKENEQPVYSTILTNDTNKKAFRIHEPKNASKETLSAIKDKIESFERYLKTIDPQKNNDINQWIDIDEYIKHYWIQEFSKNPDADFKTSVYFSWGKDGVIKMGPVWDFDLSLGNRDKPRGLPPGWYIKPSYWNKFLFKDSMLEQARIDYWTIHKDKFKSLPSKIDSVYFFLRSAAQNNYKKWNIENSFKYSYNQDYYHSFEEACEHLKEWIKQRIDWIDDNQ